MNPLLPRTQSPGLDWLRDGRRVVAASLVRAVGSSPLDPGSEMLVDDLGRIEGSVTGGCVEAALYEEAQAVLAGGAPRVARYGISDDAAVSVGLMCGGTVEVFVHELSEGTLAPLSAVRAAIEAGQAAAVATILDGPSAGQKLAVVGDEPIGSLRVTRDLDRAVARDAAGLLEHAQTIVRSYGASGEVLGADLRVYIQSFATPASLLIFGAIDFSAAVARFAGALGYRVIICDAREAFIRSERFSSVADVRVSWPDELYGRVRLGPRDAVLVFTHDPKFDIPALLGALRTQAGYIGALGSRRTHLERLERLRDAGATTEELERIAAPCGLDIGARTPEETAISVLAEVIALRAGRSGGRLAATDLPIHPATVDVAFDNLSK